MARHRNIRQLDISEEYNDYDYEEQYSRSLEDDFSVSPGTADRYLLNRLGSPQFNEPPPPPQQPEEIDPEPIESPPTSISKPTDEIDSTKLYSCIEYIQDIVGDTIAEEEIVAALRRVNLNPELALDQLLNRSDETKKKTTNTFNPAPTAGSNLYQGLTAKCNDYRTSQSDRYHEYPVRKFLKDHVVKSIIKQNSSSKRGGRKPSDGGELSTGNVIPVKAPSPGVQDEENSSSKKSALAVPKKMPTKPMETPERSAPPSPSMRTVKNIKQKSKEEILRLFQKKRMADKLQLNLVIAGHVDAGKSTIMGHLLSLLGNISKKTMHKNEQEAKKAGKASFMYAWVLDETEEERCRGVTIDVGQYRFETERRVVNILDAPGHRDFIPNMITGTTKADVAILVVDATNGEFERGFECGGQTQEHILLLRSFAITQVAIAVNKLDTVNFSQDRFNEIVEKIRKYLKLVGFKENSVSYVPCSGMTGDNLVELSKNPQFAWYKGQTLIQIIDTFLPNQRPVERPFRMAISDVFKGQTSGLYLAGKIDYGYVELNQKLLVVPNNEYCTVKNIFIEDDSQPDAFAGDVVALNIPVTDGTMEISVGHVLCDISAPCALTTRFEARIMTFSNMTTPIIKGQSLMLYSVCLCNEIVQIVRLCSLLDKSKNEVIRKNPRLLGNNQAGVVEFRATRPICIETFETFKEYGRFVFRSGHSTLGFGIVTKILS